MTKLLKRERLHLEQLSGEVESPKLNAIIAKGVIQRGEVFLFKALAAGLGDISKYFDLTDAECSVNHLHMDWNVEEPSETKCLREALAFVKKLTKLLQASYPDTNFRIILGVELRYLCYSTVRFHKLREAEATWLDIENIDNCKDEAILAVDTK